MRYARRKFAKYWPLVAKLMLGIFMLVSLSILMKFFPIGIKSLRVLFSVPGVVISYVAPTQPHIKSTDGRTHVLLLGIAGGAHDGALLSDTMMVASIEPKKNDVVLFSLPRDLWVSDLNGGTKLNAAYAYGELKRKGAGIILAKSIVSDMLGIPIHYAVRIDFRGFERAVDEIGGIRVTVDRSFDDYRYPIAGKENDLCDGDETYACRYEHVSFQKGTFVLDGARALQYVRSRMGTNNEGSDFARSRRQQKVLAAFTQKVLSVETLLNPSRVVNLIETFGENVESDIKTEEIDDFAKITQGLQSTSVRSFILDDSNDPPLLINPPPEQYGGMWVLIPRDSGALHQWVQTVLENPSILASPPREATAAAQ